jgi:outer membrane protein TolC
VIRKTSGKEAIGMNRSLIRAATYVQLFCITMLATGCAPTQPFFLNESPDLRHYLDKATQIEYPDVEVASLAETTEALPPLTLGNHNYEYWDLTLEECVSIALQNSEFFVTVAGTAEQRQNVVSQFVSGTSDQFGSVWDVALQQTSTQSIPLTIDGAGNRVVNRGVQRANQVGGVEDALAEFDAQVSSVLSYGTTDRPRNVATESAFNRQLFRAVDGSQQTAISKRFATGGIATLREQLIYSSNNLQAGLFPGNFGRAVKSDWTAILEAQITHPLMRGRGTYINRIPVVLASLNEDVSIAEFEAQIRNLVRDVEVLYWDLYCAYRDVETQIVGRNSTQATQRITAAQMTGGRTARQDLLRAESRYFEFRGRLQGALAGSNVPGSDPRGVYGIERELRARMGLASTDSRLIRPIDEPTLAHVDFDWFESSANAMFRSPEVRRSKIRLKQRQLELDYAENQLLPQVDLSLTGRLVGVGDEIGFGARSGQNFPEDPIGSSALAGLTEGNFGEIAARLEITPTAIGQRRELTRITGARHAVAREVAFIQQQELMLSHQLADAIAKLESHYDQIQTYGQQLNAADQEVQVRLSAFDAGLGEVNFVLDAQLARANAQISYYRSLCEYNKSISFVHYLRGTLLEYNNITLEEGPWPKKAYWDALERARERSAGHYYKYGYTRPNVVRTGPASSMPNPVMVEESALVPEGVADGVILGIESLDGEVIYESESPIGSGVPAGLMPPANAVDTMPELKMPMPPRVDDLPAPPANRATTN